MSPFEMATKSAIEEILKSHLCESKYGFFITKDSLDLLTSELANFIQTSRNLKNKGDDYLKKAAYASQQERTNNQ